MIPKTLIPVIPSTTPPTQINSSSSPTPPLPRTSPKPSSSISTMYDPQHSGSRLRGVLRGFRAAKSGKDLEVHQRGLQVSQRQEVQRKFVLSLHISALLQMHQFRPPDLRLHGIFLPKKVVIMKKTPEEAFEPFKNIEFKPFRDAGYGQCSYRCTVNYFLLVDSRLPQRVALRHPARVVRLQEIRYRRV